MNDNTRKLGEIYDKYKNGPKPPTRIEKLGELYDKACENAMFRLNHTTDDVARDNAIDMLTADQMAHDMDMQVIQTYLEQTKRPERASGPTGKGVTLWLDENLLTNPKQLQIAVHSEPTSITTFT